MTPMSEGRTNTLKQHTEGQQKYFVYVHTKLGPQKRKDTPYESQM